MTESWVCRGSRGSPGSQQPRGPGTEHTACCAHMMCFTMGHREGCARERAQPPPSSILIRLCPNPSTKSACSITPLAVTNAAVWDVSAAAREANVCTINYFFDDVIVNNSSYAFLGTVPHSPQNLRTGRWLTVVTQGSSPVSSYSQHLSSLLVSNLDLVMI